MQAGFWVLMVFSTGVVAGLVGFVFPKLFLSAEYVIAPLGRGVKCFREDDGLKTKGRRSTDLLTNGDVSILYEPSFEYRQYISQYILSCRNGKKVLLIKPAAEVGLDYDIVLFNKHERVFRIINVKEDMSKHTAVSLPNQTAFASIVINEVDCVNAATKGKTPAIVDKRPPKRSIGLLCAISAAAILTEVFVIKYSIANIYGDIFHQMFTHQGVEILLTLAIGLVLTGLYVAAVVVYFLHRYRRHQRLLPRDDEVRHEL